MDNHLDFVYPIEGREKKNYVRFHSLGFSEKSNVDLLKHYLRFFKKNKFRIKKNRAEKKLKQEQ